MCDYSLELYKSEPAAQGETYKLITFPSGTKGFIVDKEPEVEVGQRRAELAPCAACIPGGSMLQLIVGDETETVEMIRLNNEGQHIHRDAVRFGNGGITTLQTLPAGTKATVVVLGNRNAPEDWTLASTAPPPSLAVPAPVEPIAVPEDLSVFAR